MPTLLFINACVRGKDSRTLALCERLLTSIKEANQKDMAFKIEEIRLSTENLIPLNYERLQRRDELLANGIYEDSMFDYANAMAQADMIVIGAPYWDMSFPASLGRSMHGLRMFSSISRLSVMPSIASSADSNAPLRNRRRRTSALSGANSRSRKTRRLPSSDERSSMGVSDGTAMTAHTSSPCFKGQSVQKTEKYAGKGNGRPLTLHEAERNGARCAFPPQKPMVITHEMCYTICNETSRGGLFQCN